MLAAKRQLRIIALAVVLGGAGAFVWQSQTVRHQLALSFSRQATPYTELYFSDYNRLPLHLSTAERNYISFTITNHEGKAMAYSYVVTAASSLRTVAVASGRLRLGTGRLSHETVTFSPRRPATPYRLSVRLSAPRPLTIAFTATS